MFKKTTGSLVAATVLGLSLAACGGTAEKGASSAPNNEATMPPKQAEPVKLVMLQDGATITDDEFKNLIAAPIHAKYPNITVEMRRNTAGDKGIQDLIAGGDFPDFIFTTYPRITLHRDLGTSHDLTELVKAHNMDLGKFDPAAMETSRVYGGKNKLYAVPFSLNFFALFYNKDLFDTFGVPYPTDGMTWDDVYEVARKFSRVVDGVQYRGVHLPGLLDMSTQLTLPYVNQMTGKANVETDGWKRLFAMVKKFNDIPGSKGGTVNHFLKDQTVAMSPGYDVRITSLEALNNTPQQFNWDLVQFPSYPDLPNVAGASSGHFLMLSALSKHKEEAFQAIDLLTGAETQKLITNNGRFTSLNDQALKEMYGNNIKSLQGKNTKGVFKSKFAPPYAPSKNDPLVQPHLNTAMTKVINDETDINSALRDAGEAANRDIAAKSQ